MIGGNYPAWAEPPVAKHDPVRSRSAVALFAATVILGISCWVLDAYAAQLDAAVRQNSCVTCEDPGGFYVTALVGVLMDTVIVFALFALTWLAGYPRWYLRVPLAIMSVAIGGLGLIAALASPVAGILAMTGAVAGFVVALWPASEASKGTSLDSD